MLQSQTKGCSRPAFMDDSDIEQSRSPKRRRVNGDSHDTSRYSSPDELAASSDHEAPYIRRRSSNILRDRETAGESRRRSYDESPSDESPDELDHTIHTFYRDNRTRSRRESRDQSVSGQSLRSIGSSPWKSIRKERPLRYKQKLVLRGHKRGVAAVRFSPDGLLIASCCESHSIIVYI